MSKPRILTVIRPVQGGMQAHLLNILVNMQNEFDFTVACPVEQAAFFRDRGCETAVLPIRGEFRPYSDLRTAWKLHRLLRTGSYQLVHAHGFKAAALARPPAGLARVPCLVTVHGELADGTGGRRKAVWRRSERVLARWTAGYITVSQWLAAQLTEAFGIPAGRITVIPNGVRLHSGDRGTAGMLPFAGHMPLVGTVARLAPQKGIHYFLEAAKRVLATCPAARFLVVGDGPLRGELEGLCRSLGIEGCVAFTGHRSDVPAILRQLTVFVLPSLSEGQGISVLEAMAAGCPVVASDAGGLRELVEHEKTGLQVQAGNTEELSRAILRYLADGNLKKEMAERAKAYIVQYQEKDMFRQTAELYRRFLEGRVQA